ncbi:MAG: hypothetical protein HDS35_09005 [Bacteroides sp.]|nr:hypothetical protein [Bacteroides sp.]
MAILIAFIKLLCHRQTGILIQNIRIGYVAQLITWTIGLVIIGIIFTIINGAFEFSRTGALCSLLIGLVSVVIVYTSLNVPVSGIITSRELMERMIVYIFVIQSFISIGSFVSPGFKAIISNFQFPGEADLAEEAYSGVRGLALSGRLYFEFAATCGLVTIFQFKRIVEEDRVTISALILLLLVVICGFFAGRTALVGFGVGFMYIVLAKTGIEFKLSFILRLVLITGLLCTAIWCILPSDIKDFVTQHLLPWVFDLFIKYFETGSTESSHSFNSLNEMYDNVQISEHEWIIGSGMYMEPSGRYYGHVDAGYLRQILYWGIMGTLVSLAYTLKIFQFSWDKSSEDKNQHLFILTIIIYTLIVHYKGDLLSISRFYYVIIYLYLISIWKTYQIQRQSPLNENHCSNRNLSMI